jgi:hypothetical protein
MMNFAHNIKEWGTVGVAAISITFGISTAWNHTQSQIQDNAAQLNAQQAAISEQRAIIAEHTVRLAVGETQLNNIERGVNDINAKLNRNREELALYNAREALRGKNTPSY